MPVSGRPRNQPAFHKPWRNPGFRCTLAKVQGNISFRLRIVAGFPEKIAPAARRRGSEGLRPFRPGQVGWPGLRHIRPASPDCPVRRFPSRPGPALPTVSDRNCPTALAGSRPQVLADPPGRSRLGGRSGERFGPAVSFRLTATPGREAPFRHRRPHTRDADTRDADTRDGRAAAAAITDVGLTGSGPAVPGATVSGAAGVGVAALDVVDVDGTGLDLATPDAVGAGTAGAGRVVAGEAGAGEAGAGEAGAGEAGAGEAGAGVVVVGGAGAGVEAPASILGTAGSAVGAAAADGAFDNTSSARRWNAATAALGLP
jgi:hypothetical protein